MRLMSVGPVALRMRTPAPAKDWDLLTALLAWSEAPLWNSGHCLHPGSFRSWTVFKQNSMKAPRNDLENRSPSRIRVKSVLNGEA